MNAAHPVARCSLPSCQAFASGAGLGYCPGHTLQRGRAPFRPLKGEQPTTWQEIRRRLESCQAKPGAIAKELGCTTREVYRAWEARQCA
ncbi:hypothetical protein [Pseudomonas benzopyrenica]|uniref:hypothetical protein n=1 Tax=Pseudomonas benzopyrenica TaxID=2993566 RepID=UPI003F15FCD3